MRSLSLLVAVFLGAGCGVSMGGGGPGTAAPLPPESARERDQLRAAAAQAWRARDSRASVEKALDDWQRAVELDPSLWQVHERLAHATHFYADTWVERADRERALVLYQQGMEHAESGMRAASPRFSQLVRTGVDVANAAEVIGAEHIGLVYWYAINLGAYARAKDTKAALEHKDRIIGMVEHVYETSPDYYHRAADRFFAAFYAAAPAFVGGDLDKSKTHFQAALRGSPNYLGTYVLMAEYYARKTDDQALLEELVGKVIDARPCSAPAAATPCIEPALAGEAVIDKQRARKLLGFALR